MIYTNVCFSARLWVHQEGAVLSIIKYQCLAVPSEVNESKRSNYYVLVKVLSALRDYTHVVPL